MDFLLTTTLPWSKDRVYNERNELTHKLPIKLHIKDIQILKIHLFLSMIKNVIGA